MMKRPWDAAAGMLRTEKASGLPQHNECMVPQSSLSCHQIEILSPYTHFIVRRYSSMTTEIRRILFGMSGIQHDSNNSRFVFELAQTVGAEIQSELICPVADDPELLLACGFTGNAFRSLSESAAKTTEDLDTVARAALLLSQQKYPDVHFSYQVPDAITGQSLANKAWAADLVILAHPSLMKAQYYWSVVEDTILEAGRPVLLLPEVLPPKLTSHVSILWRNDANSARALAACLGMIKLADKVSILNLDLHEESEKNLAIPLEFLRIHGISALVATGSPSGQRIEQQMQDYGNETAVSLWVCGGGLTGGFNEHFFGHLIRRSYAKAQRAILIIE
jgi:hypothetical protein